MVKSAALYTPSRETFTKSAVAILFAGGFLSVTASCVTEKALADDRVEVELPSNPTFPARVETPPATDESPKPSEARPPVVLSEKEALILRRMLADDFSTHAQGGESVFGEQAGASEYVAVSADDLQKQYERNEVAGDKKFRGKRLILDGKVASIDHSIGENYFVSLRGGTNQFMRPKAMMADGHTDYLAELEKGQTIRLVCEGDGLLMASAMVSDCIPAALWVEQMTTSKMNELPQLIRSKDKPFIHILAIALGLTEVLPETSACWSKGPTTPADRCSKEIALAVKKLTGKTKADVEFKGKLAARVKAMLE